MQSLLTWNGDLQRCIKTIELQSKTFSIPLARAISTIDGRIDFYMNRERLPGTDNQGRAIYRNNQRALQVVIPIMDGKTMVGDQREVIYLNKEGSVSSLPETTGWLKRMKVDYSLQLAFDCTSQSNICSATLVQSGKRVNIRTKPLTLTIVKETPS